MGLWAITKSMVKLHLHNPVEASQPPMRTCSPVANIKRLAWLVVLTGALFIAASTLTACVDSAEPTVEVTTVEVTRRQTPAPDAALTATTVLHVPWTRLEFRIVPRGVHRIEFEMNTEETLEYHYNLCCGLSGGDGPIGAMTNLVQSFTGSLDIRLAITGPSGDV